MLFFISFFLPLKYFAVSLKLYLPTVYAFKNFDIAHNGCGNRTSVGIASFNYNWWSWLWKFILWMPDSFYFWMCIVILKYFCWCISHKSKVIFGRYWWTLFLNEEIALKVITHELTILRQFNAIWFKIFRKTNDCSTATQKIVSIETFNNEQNFVTEGLMFSVSNV